MLEKAVDFVSKNKGSRNDKYLPTYHFAPEIGWINDPNGFSKYRGKYHLFYQYNPFSAVWGQMHWGHATSDDLIIFKHEKIAISPIEEGVEGGAAFSGTAIEVDGKHIVMYTEHWGYKQVQSVAISDDGITYKRLANCPVITEKNLPSGFTMEHFRDPKIMYRSGKYIALIALKDNEGNGNIAAFKSNNLIDWEYKGLTLKHIPKMGTMWECPDMVTIGDHDILTISPQWMSDVGLKYANLHSSAYFIGKFDVETLKYDFIMYDEIDRGLDFYAPEMIVDGDRVLMIAWMNMWERTQPTKELEHNWAGSMTLPREVIMKNEKLYFRPIQEIKKYRGKLNKSSGELCENTVLIKNSEIYELELELKNINAEFIKLELFKVGNESVELSYSKITKELIFDRSNCGVKIEGNREYEINSNQRRVNMGIISDLKLQIFSDKSSIEIFINDGEYVITSLVFPTYSNSIVEISSCNGSFDYCSKYWDLKF